MVIEVFRTNLVSNIKYDGQLPLSTFSNRVHILTAETVISRDTNYRLKSSIVDRM